MGNFGNWKRPKVIKNATTEQNELQRSAEGNENNVQRQDLWQSETKIRITLICTLSLFV